MARLGLNMTVTKGVPLAPLTFLSPLRNLQLTLELLLQLPLGVLVGRRVEAPGWSLALGTWGRRKRILTLGLCKIRMFQDISI